MINHIVVAVDASPSSDNAVDLGIPTTTQEIIKCYLLL